MRTGLFCGSLLSCFYKSEGFHTQNLVGERSTLGPLGSVKEPKTAHRSSANLRFEELLKTSNYQQQIRPEYYTERSSDFTCWRHIDHPTEYFSYRHRTSCQLRSTACSERLRDVSTCCASYAACVQASIHDVLRRKWQTGDV